MEGRSGRTKGKEGTTEGMVSKEGRKDGRNVNVDGHVREEKNCNVTRW
jgi:hypothetical protein